MTQLLVPKSPCVSKKSGGWGCGSEQAHLKTKLYHVYLYVIVAFYAKICNNRMDL